MDTLAGVVRATPVTGRIEGGTTTAVVQVGGATGRAVVPLSVDGDAMHSYNRRRRKTPCLCVCFGTLLVGAFVVSLAVALSAGSSSYDDDYDSDSDSGAASSYYAGSHSTYYTPSTYAYYSMNAYISVTSPVSGSSYAHGDTIPVEWSSAGVSVDSSNNKAYLDVYYCTSYDEDTACFNNGDCTHTGRWEDSHKAGSFIFNYATGTLYICLEDYKYIKPFGYSGAFTMSANRRLESSASAASETAEPQEEAEAKAEEKGNPSITIEDQRGTPAAGGKAAHTWGALGLGHRGGVASDMS